MRISDWSSDVCSSDLRRAWKHELMAAVDARVHAAPVAAPGPDRWNAVNAKDDAYRRVTASGTFRHDRETLVQAVTERGAGYWVVTPLEKPGFTRSEEHTSELQSLMRITYAVFCLTRQTK